MPNLPTVSLPTLPVLALLFRLHELIEHMEKALTLAIYRNAVDERRFAQDTLDNFMTNEVRMGCCI